VEAIENSSKVGVNAWLGYQKSGKFSRKCIWRGVIGFIELIEFIAFIAPIKYA
jgi:hypothetical protein